MNDNFEMGGRILPGVDLTLWLRILVVLVLAIAIGGVALATV